MMLPGRAPLSAALRTAGQLPHLRAAALRAFSTSAEAADPAPPAPPRLSVGDLTPKISHGPTSVGPFPPAKHVVLAIETSCDDTCVSVVDSNRMIRSNIQLSQFQALRSFQGVHPRVASAFHSTRLPIAIRTAIQTAGIHLSDLSAVAVTRGPGLSPCLAAGIASARVIAATTNLPLLGVHHMEAHALTARLTPLGRVHTPEDISTMPAPANIDFPFLCVLISGGHTLIVVVRSLDHFEVLGTTRDNSIGVAFDKVSRSLGLAWQAGALSGATPSGIAPGAALELAAEHGDPTAFNYSVPLAKHPGIGFSYAGLMSSVIQLIEAEASPSEEFVNNIAASFQQTAWLHMQQQLNRTARHLAAEMGTFKHLVVSGGVAQNRFLRNGFVNFAEKHGLTPSFPPAALCSDNAAMIAWAALERLEAMEPQALGCTSLPDFGFISSWPLDTRTRERQQAEAMADPSANQTLGYHSDDVRLLALVEGELASQREHLRQEALPEAVEQRAATAQARAERRAAARRQSRERRDAAAAIPTAAATIDNASLPCSTPSS
ncbi:hypothetical protein H696_02020 [Fonticula alba]|uniref:N(6)-L-threonylcarbamoyladenine synthase n=1 Tax=Fonticula alba TaxID=691883 RepID=A0A058ZA10_FONAL|nr:hypothetical protein H696_02020 [Fonticula alba]KCV71070.1 hypothetical protein H696_02020 [Fonticula alba]|eukprot:XP_009494193.1 hypothetical protein H696_02020 [Fonticula alba]